MSCVAQEVGPEQYSPMREAERVSLGSGSSANAEQRTLEEAPSSEHQVINTEAEAGTALEDEGEREGGAQALEPQTTNSVSLAEQGQLEGCKSVGESTIEDSERLGLVSENSFVGEQKRDEPLADVRQAVSPVKKKREGPEGQSLHRGPEAPPAIGVHQLEARLRTTLQITPLPLDVSRGSHVDADQSSQVSDHILLPQLL
ncbi:hypothetical protein MTO96_031855 [Rhipicephalus appendiculatus]